jgi:hypothetical protein
VGATSCGGSLPHSRPPDRRWHLGHFLVHASDQGARVLGQEDGDKKIGMAVRSQASKDEDEDDLVPATPAWEVSRRRRWERAGHLVVLAPGHSSNRNRVVAGRTAARDDTALIAPLQNCTSACQEPLQ